MNDRHAPKPANVQRCWFGVISCLQAQAPSRGAAVVRLGIIVDAAGCPVNWGEPQVLRIHPAKRSTEFQNTVADLAPAEVDELIDHLT